MKKLTFILSITLTLSAFAQVPSYVPTNGLVGWWPFNGNANDESGNGNNGTVNGATLTTDRFGEVGNAYQFNAANANNIVMQAVNGSNALSLSYWVFSSITNNGVVAVQNNISNSSQTAFSSFFGVNNNNPSNLITGSHSGGACSSFGNTVISGTPSTQFLNAWQNITIVYYSSGNVDLYINGQLAASQNGSSYSVCSLNNSLRIGGPWWNNDPCYFQGKIDDIGIWNRALTNQEVAALYNGCQQSIQTQPQSQTASFNDNVQFTAASSDPNATYQWQTNVGLGFQNLSDAGQYAGTSMNTLNVSNVGVLNVNQEFRCVIQSGSCTDTTDVATLQVCGGILVQPSNESVLLNANAQFTYSSTDPNATYQWQTNLGLGFQNLTDAGQYSGSVTNTLNVSNVTLSNNNQQFRCIIASGSCSDTSDVALLSVNDNLSISENSEQLVSVYPNPAKETITISSDASIVGKDFSIINQLGQVVILGKIVQQEMSVDLSDLTNGVYVIRIDGIEKSSFRIVKE